MLTLSETKRHFRLSGAVTARDADIESAMEYGVSVVLDRVGVKVPQSYAYIPVASSSSRWLIQDNLATLDNVGGLDKAEVTWIDDDTGNRVSASTITFKVYNAYSSKTKRRIGIEVRPSDDWTSAHDNVPDTVQLRYITGYSVSDAPARWKRIALQVAWDKYKFPGLSGNTDANLEAMLRGIAPVYPVLKNPRYYAA